MPCDGVIVARYQVVAGALAKLVAPAQVAALLTAFAKSEYSAQYTNLNPSPGIRGSNVTMTIRTGSYARYQVYVRDGLVDVTSEDYSRSQCKALATRLAAMLDGAGRRVMAGEITIALTGLGQVSMTDVEIDTAGQRQPATLVKLRF